MASYLHLYHYYHIYWIPKTQSKQTDLISLTVWTLSPKDLKCVRCEQSLITVLIVLAERDRLYCNECESKSESDAEKPQWLQDGKPYKCDRCQAMFRYKGNLASHKSVHTGKQTKIYSSVMLSQICLLQFVMFKMVYNYRRETVPLQRMWSSVQQACQSEDTFTDPLRRKTIQM